MKTNPVIAIAIADLHLSATPPVARAGEPCWFSAMKRPLDELRAIQYPWGCPILCAGDVFHHWKAPPELINFALEYLPPMYSIPGQHDMPFHRADQLHKSAYTTLVRAGVLTNFNEDVVTIRKGAAGGSMGVFGFGWGVKAFKPKLKVFETRVCVQHAYRWAGQGTGYSGAPGDQILRVSEYNGYDIVIIGDNHISWDSTDNQDHRRVHNVGSFMRRNADQGPHRPRAILIHADGQTSNHYFDTTKDVLDTSGAGDERLIGRLNSQTGNPTLFLELSEQLQKLHGDTQETNFADSLRHALADKRLGPPVRKLLTEALEHARR
jgi:hypothetical protein